MHRWIAAGALLLTLGIGTGTATAAAADAPQGGASAASVRELLAATHVTAMMQQAMQQMGQQLDVMVKQRLPCLSPSAVSSALTAPQATQQLIDLVMPIYQHNFTEQDVHGLLAFYRTPLGQKLLKVQPVIIRESMLAGEQWGRQRVEQRIGQLKSEGKLTAQGSCPVAPAASASVGH